MSKKCCVAVVLALLLTLVAACGGDEVEKKSSPSAAEASPSPTVDYSEDVVFPETDDAEPDPGRIDEIVAELAAAGSADDVVEMAACPFGDPQELFAAAGVDASGASVEATRYVAESETDTPGASCTVDDGAGGVTAFVTGDPSAEASVDQAQQDAISLAAVDEEQVTFSRPVPWFSGTAFAYCYSGGTFCGGVWTGDSLQVLVGAYDQGLDSQSAADWLAATVPAVVATSPGAGGSGTAELPDLLTAGGAGVETGGEYVDSDGYTARVDIKVYDPVGLDGDVSQELELCPGATDEGDVPSVSDQLAEKNLKTDGGIAWAFEMSISSPDAEFPFPLAERLSESEGSGLGSSQPGMVNTDLHPDFKLSRTCAVSQDETSASWIGFTTLLPENVSTPNNPDGKLPEIYDEPLSVRLNDPLFDLTSDLDSPWESQPNTDYGPTRGGFGDNGWSFAYKIAPFKVRFLALR